ncbi:MAG TPA: hypothetical protein VFW03_16100 [Gemmatimonadaceae bacterium]|nr:hypothetical protein [Gemmatimonadaceae bacterium]
MCQSSLLTRALSRVTLLLQLLLPTVVSVADARVERDAMSARAYSHVEATTGKDCARAHKADCALCQHLTTPLAKSAKAAPPVAAGRCERPAVSFGVSRLSGHSEGPALPRAPPAC